MKSSPSIPPVSTPSRRRPATRAFKASAASAAAWALIPAAAFSSISCSASRRTLVSGLGAGAGALGGALLAPDGASARKRALYAGGGALAGALLAGGYDAWTENSENAARLEGYERGQADAVRRQYWIAQRAQALPPSPEEEAREQRERERRGGTPRLYEIPVPEHVTADGVIKAPSMRVLSVVE